MTTRGTPTAHPSPAPKRPSKTASTQSLNHLLNFSLPPRQTQQPPSLPRRSRRNGTQQAVWNKERFVNAQYRFLMNPTGDYTVHFADPDIFFQWNDILQVIIPRNSASASATGGGQGSLQAEGVITCPICLSPPTAPRMTKCGHVFCFPCILHYLSTSDDLKWVRCPICFDSVNERQLKAVVWTDAPLYFDDESDEPHAEASSSSASLDAAPSFTPQPGSMLRMRLMQRPQITTLALPRSATWPSDLLPPHQAPFHFLPDVYAFAKFMLATPSYLVENLNRDVAELATERHMLDSMNDPIGMVFVDAAEQRLQAQIEKAKALDTEPLRDAIDKALQLQHEIEARASHHQQRRKLQQEIPAAEKDVPEAYLASRSPATATPPVTAPVTARNSKQRRNVNPPPPSTSTYYYYQAASGTPVFLHPLDIKILHAHFNGYASFPDTITVRVEAHSEGAVNDDLRRRCKYLAHMPAGADVVFASAAVAREVLLRHVDTPWVLWPSTLIVHRPIEGMCMHKVEQKHAPGAVVGGVALLYVHGFGEHATRDDLVELFMRYGPVLALRISDEYRWAEVAYRADKVPVDRIVRGNLAQPLVVRGGILTIERRTFTGEPWVPIPADLDTRAPLGVEEGASLDQIPDQIEKVERSGSQAHEDPDRQAELEERRNRRLETKNIKYEAAAAARRRVPWYTVEDVRQDWLSQLGDEDDEAGWQGGEDDSTGEGDAKAKQARNTLKPLTERLGPP